MNIQAATTNLIEVDYSASLESLIDDGDYHWISPHITRKNFPVTASGRVRLETKVMRFNRIISTEEAVDAIKIDDKDNPWGPATIEALLVFVVRNHDMNRKYRMIALGSVAAVCSRPRVPCIARHRLGFAWWNENLQVSDRFLAVRNLTSTT